MRPELSLMLLMMLEMQTACAHARPDYYTPDACQSLRREARGAGTYRVGASAISLGLGAGGAVAPLVSDSKGATVALALGAVLAGAVGLAAGYRSDEAQKEWAEECPTVAIPATY